MQQMDERRYDNFDDMVIQANKIRIVKLNRECWENSKCNCKNSVNDENIFSKFLRLLNFKANFNITNNGK